MKKILGIALAAVLAFGALGARAEEAVQLGGVVEEVTASTVLISTAHYGDVLINYDGTTELEGLTDGIRADTYVIVDYSGAMTRSVPPQIFAQKISMHVIDGTVVEVGDLGVLVEEASSDQIFVRLSDDMGPLFYGCPVDVYFSGVMAMSYPGQVSALYVVTPTLYGTISELDDGYFLMDGVDGQEYMVNNCDGTHLDGALNVGDGVSIYFNGAVAKSEPPQIYAIAVFHADR